MRFISIMMITLFLLTIGQIWPITKPYMDVANDALILVRVGMTVLYGHIVHSLGKSQSHSVPSSLVDALHTQLEAQRQEIERIRQETSDTITLLKRQQQEAVDTAIREIKQGLTTNLVEKPDNLVDNLVEISPSISTTLSTVEVRPHVADGLRVDVEPMTSLVETLSKEEIHLVIEAYKSGVVKSKMCSHLHWSTSKYKAIGAVIEQYNKVVEKV